MPVPVYATDLTDIYVSGAGNFSALGGGASGLNDETDYFFQGSDCKSKNAWTNAIKGLIHDTVTGITVPTDGIVMFALYYSATNSLEVKEPGSPADPGGLMALIGSSTSDYNRFNVAGSDTLVFDCWGAYPVDPTVTPSNVVGTPSGTLDHFGVEANLPTTSGPTKGAPIAIDSCRYGRGQIIVTGGDVSTPATFQGISDFAHALARRWGLFYARGGGFEWQGLLSIGNADASPADRAHFVDADVSIVIPERDKVGASFNRIEVKDGSVCDWNNVKITSLNFISPGDFENTDGDVDWVGCQFTDMGTFTFLATDVVLDCIFSGCGQITAPGTDFQGQDVKNYTGATDTSALVWNVATDPDGLLDGTEFTKGTGTTHAIEFGLTSPLTMTLNDVDFLGYNAANGENDSALHIKRTSGTVTINISGGTTPSYKTDGATVNIVAGAVSATVTALETDGTPIENARVILVANNTGSPTQDRSGPFPVDEFVTISNSGTTATVTHDGGLGSPSLGHGMATNDKVLIEGASHWQNNGVFPITVIDSTHYSYTLPGDPGSSPTGTILASYVVLEGLTNASGQITMSRVFSSSQPVTGHVRKSSASPFFKTSPLTGTVDNALGFSATAVMVSDE